MLFTVCPPRCFSAAWLEVSMVNSGYSHPSPPGETFAVKPKWKSWLTALKHGNMIHRVSRKSQAQVLPTGRPM